MNPASAREASGNRIYQAVKARAVRYEFPEGRRILLEPLADQLRVSTTPVREALNRLAAEGLVVKAPRKGFVALSLDTDRLKDHYRLIRLLLAHELGGLSEESLRRLPEFEPIADLLRKLNRRPLTNVETLAMYTGELFIRLAALSENADVVEAIDRANDQLFFIRTVECRLLDGIHEELIRHCELVLAGRCDDLIKAIHEYHRKRLDLLPRLLKRARA